MKKIIFLLFVYTTTLLSLRGQDSPPAEPKPDAEKAPAHVRVWAMVFGEKSPFSLQLVRPDAEPQSLLESQGDKPIQGRYAEVPKGDVELRLNSGGVPVTSSRLKLRPGDFQTVIVFKKGNKLQLDVLQDPLPGQKDFPPTVRLLNFGTGRNAEIKMGGDRKVVVPDNSYVLSPFSGKGDIELLVTLPDPSGGPAATSITDINGKSPSWSVVVIPDYRGRFRPKVSPDGREE